MAIGPKAIVPLLFWTILRAVTILGHATKPNRSSGNCQTMASRTDVLRPRPLFRRTTRTRRFTATRQLSLDLVARLSDADASVQSMPDASPAKWHLAHTDGFFETFVLRDHCPGYSLFDDRFAYLFNSYYEAEGPRHSRPRGLLDATVARCGARLARACRCGDPGKALSTLSPAARALVELGIHHEQQHQELLLTDIKHLFAQNPLGPAVWDAPDSAIANEVAAQFSADFFGIVRRCGAAALDRGNRRDRRRGA